MRTAFSRISGMTAQQRAALADEFDRVSRISVAEPVAVVGIGCRFPGDVTGPDSYWDLLTEGRNAISSIPAERWDAEEFYDPDPFTPGRMTTKWGGFLPDVAGFDAEFFGITPREAAAMDPQQRILLEVCWEALENAGVPPDSLGGTRTGVMMGVYFTEYQSMLAANPENVDAYSGTGNAHGVTVGRISYLLGLRGPAVAVDTACSSSLVALHLACQSLRLRETDVALAGGVSVTLRPETQIAISAWGLLSPHGRCATFDAAADGFVRGEGAGVVVLKRLTDAVRDGDHVLAVVRGSAVNQDGRSNGVTAPNTAAQCDVIADALRSGDLAPDSVHYVEVHGTGTALGDPIEFEALAATYGRGADGCALGAVKTNLGHLEAAAGIAGFIKTVMALQHGKIPPNLHFSQWNPAIDASPTRLFVPTENTPWPTVDGPRRAAVSSFGLGGTNAHVLVEQGPEAATVPATHSSPGVSTLVLSGKTPQRVASWASVLAEWMAGAGAGVGLADVAHSLNHHRAQHACFATVCARDHGQAVAGLQALAAGQPADGVVGPHDGRCGPGTVFVYSGQGSQWTGMGKRLLADEPAFAAAVAELEPVFVAEVGFSLHQVLAGGEPVDGIERIQPVLVGVQLALTELWRSYGVTPDAVIGHSMGEVSAAVVSGALSVAEGLRVIAIRSRLMARLSGQGAMALLELGPADTEALIGAHPEVTLAVYASPRQSVIAGPPEVVDKLCATVAKDHRLARRIEVEVASHHPTIDPVLDELRSALAGLAPASPTIPIISTTYETSAHTGHPPVFDADHWAANLRNPVRFQQAIAQAGGADGAHHTFIEISPHPLLTHTITDTLATAHHHCVATLRRDTDDTRTFHTNLNATHTTHPPQTPHPPEPHPVLPPTPWQHTRHWISATSAARHSPDTHPLLGIGVIDPTNDTRVWQSELDPDLFWLADHAIDDLCVLPGAAYAEVALAAATEAFAASEDAQEEQPWVIGELTLHQVLHVTKGTVFVTTLTGDEQLCQVEMRTRSTSSGWITHATATVTRATTPDLEGPAATDGASDATDELDPDDLYQRLRGAGQHHGPAFRGIVGLGVSASGAAHAQVRLPPSAKAGARNFVLHPVMMDIALQTLGATRLATELTAQQTPYAAQTLVLPVRFAGIHVYGNIADGVSAVGSLAATDGSDRLVGEVVLRASDGRPLLVIDEIEMAVLGSDSGTSELADRLFTTEWEPTPLDTTAAARGGLLLIGDPDADDPLLPELQSSLQSRLAEIEGVEAGVDLVSPRDEATLRAAITRTDTARDSIVVLCPPRSVDESLPDQAQLELARARTLLIADVVKTVTRMGLRNSPRLWIVTRGAQQVKPDMPVTLAQNQLRGIARVLKFEHPELRTTLLDIEPDGTGSLAALTAELLAGSEHDEIALRDGQRWVNRLVPAPTTATGDLAIESRHTVVDLDSPGAAGSGLRLQIEQPGRLDALAVHEAKRIPPQADQVEVRVIAAGLNFSDVLKAMGVYPGLDGAAPVLGGECVGTVTARGDDVDALEIGQRVIAFGPGTFGSYLTTLADLVVPIPDAMPDREAATFGIAYLTAWHALCEVGRLSPGERVLIHSATGGVGLAALSIARMIGARIYTTAGSDTKRDMLSGLGVEYVGDSRSTAFAEEILDVTSGYGVDVVLNSLPGEAIQRGVQILAPGGRFIELGKKDVYADANLGLAALAKSASFAVVDLDLNLRLQPARYRQLLQHILGHVADGALQVLPVREFGLHDAADAFRLMASGKHTGKIVISMPDGGRIDAIASPPPQPLVSRDGGYLVVGGMGGLGFVVARWLVEQGAGLVVLNGRSAPGDDVAEAIADLNVAGRRVEVVTGDIADADTADRLVQSIEDAGFRLAGVVHSAMVLADEIVLNMSESAAQRVFAPKVAGSWRLHQATAHADVDWWLIFSSAASLLGSPGQGAYAAANSWVDGLVAHRRSLGLPAVGINWGPWAEVGRAQFFADLGISMITVEQGLAAMQTVLAADRAHTGVFSLDVRQWFQSFPATAGSSLFAKLHDSATLKAGARRGGGAIRVRLDALDAAQRPGQLAVAISEEIAAVVRSSDPIDHDRPLESLGLDSLMALELRNRLEAGLGIELPVALVWAYPTITDLAAALCERMDYAPSAQQTRDEFGASDAEAELSDEEMDLLSDLVEASELEAATKGEA